MTNIPNKTQNITITRTHKIHISKSNKNLYRLLDDASFSSKNLYNRGLYIERQIYHKANKNIVDSKFIKYTELYTILKDEDCLKNLNKFHSGLSQQTLKLVTQNISAFKQSIIAYSKDSTKFLGLPKFPKYLNKSTGRYILDFTYLMFKIQNNKITFTLNSQTLSFDIPDYLKGIVVKPRQKKSFTEDDINQQPNLTLDQIRVVPKHNSYDIELIYTRHLTIQIPTEPKIASIDIGMNNIATLAFIQPNLDPLLFSGKYLKSYNKNFNKKLASLVSKIDIAKNTNDQSSLKNYINQKKRLLQKRNQYFNTNMHQIASLIVKHLIQTQTTHLIIGYNQTWKQNCRLLKKVNQTFIQLPFLDLIKILEYKCQEHGIIVSRTEESYTSGTSFLDQELPTKQNYNKKRRIHRGLFRSSTKKFIHSDVNAALQIAKKKLPNINQIQPSTIQYQHPKVIVLPKTFNQTKIA